MTLPHTNKTTHACCGHSHGSGAPPPLAAGIATALCAVAATVGWAFSILDAPWAHWASLAAFVVAYLSGGAEPALHALSDLVRGKLNVDLLMIVAAAGAAAIGEWPEGAVLLFLFSLSSSVVCGSVSTSI